MTFGQNHITAAVPAIVAEVRNDWRVVAHHETYLTQATAEKASIANNLKAASAVVKEIAANPWMLGEVQVITELEERFRFLSYHEPARVAELRAALATLGPIPEPVQSQEDALTLDFIKTYVAPLRDPILPVAQSGVTLMDKLTVLQGLDEDETDA